MGIRAPAKSSDKTVSSTVEFLYSAAQIADTVLYSVKSPLHIDAAAVD